MDSDFIKTFQALRLRDAVFDHHRIEILHVRDADELVDIRVVALISSKVGMRGLPLLMGKDLQPNEWDSW